MVVLCILSDLNSLVEQNSWKEIYQAKKRFNSASFDYLFTIFHHLKYEYVA